MLAVVSVIPVDRKTDPQKKRPRQAPARRLGWSHKAFLVHTIKPYHPAGGGRRPGRFFASITPQ